MSTKTQMVNFTSSGTEKRGLGGNSADAVLRLYQILIVHVLLNSFIHAASLEQTHCSYS